MAKRLKIIIVGYHEFLASLVKGTINSNHEIIGVLRDDRVKYSKFSLFFKDIFNPSVDYSFIKSMKLNDINANSVNSKKFLMEIEKLKPDYILVGSWSEKFSKEVLDKIKVINCHPSILPKHRGANPYYHILFNGEKTSGVTFHFMDENYDTGDILFQSTFKIDDDMNAYELKLKSSKVAEIMLIDLLNDLMTNKIIPTKQNENNASLEYQINEKDIILDFTRTLEETKNHIRAFSPYFKPHFFINNYLYEAKNWCFTLNNSYIEKYKEAEIIDKSERKITYKLKDGAITLEF